ncbi:unnamed protein product [Rhizophagus irregularis]|uniref:Uncharacterized protein n=1 Tax=Rhizophagus irregularis TaxID=588596 RepID=A0A915YPX1_9GLOM|nr:unnamed protein product [Rhizophagus irregularis]CAB5302396.1 unnamed protein product [Rhizophagus irregularis]
MTETKDYLQITLPALWNLEGFADWCASYNGFWIISTRRLLITICLKMIYGRRGNRDIGLSQQGDYSSTGRLTTHLFSSLASHGTGELFVA